MDIERGQGDSALPIQNNQAGWTDVVYLAIHVPLNKVCTPVVLRLQCQASREPYMLCQASPAAMA